MMLSSHVRYVIDSCCKRILGLHDSEIKCNPKVVVVSSKRIETLRDYTPGLLRWLRKVWYKTKKFHKIASSVFLGGSIVERGGQNPLEAARYGARILHGPNTDNFKDIYKLLKSLKVSKKIKTPNELASLIIFKKNKNIGVKIKKIGEKILKKTIKELDSLINNEFKKT